LSKQRRYLIALAYATLFLYGLVDNSRGPVFPDILRDFSLDDSRGSVFFWSASGSALIANLSATWWLAKLGELGSLRLFSIVQGAGLAILAFARSYELLIFGAVILGIGFGGIGLLVNLLTAHAAPSHLRRQLMSGLHCMYGVSSLAIPIAVTAVYEAGSGWRAVFALLLLGPIAVFMTSFGGKMDVPEAKEHETEAKSEFPWGRTVWYSAVIPIYVIVEIMVSTRLVLHARRDLGSTIEDANRLLSLFYVGMFTGRLVVALVKVPLSHAKLQMISIVATGAAVSAGLLVHPGYLALSGLTMSYFYPVSMARLNDELGAHTTRAMSWVLTLQAVGLLAMHAGVGALSDAIGLSRALWTGPVCLALVTVLLVFGRPRESRG
jgi:fucose permease